MLKTPIILMDFPMPIVTPRLLLRPPAIGDGRIVNEAVLESFNELCPWMPWTNAKPTIDESEEFVRQACANWILKKNEEPYLPIFIFEKSLGCFLGATGYHHMEKVAH